MTPSLLLLTLQLTTATIEVDLTAGRVSASYTLSADRDGTELIAARVSDIRGLMGGTLRTSDGTYRVEAVGNEVGLSYEIDGNAPRIPLFVPDVPTAAAAGAVTIVIRGVSGEARVGDGFPRMTRREDGAVVATPANVPSFIIVPPDGRIGVNQVADTFVILLLVGATLFWIVRRRRAT